MNESPNPSPGRRNFWPVIITGWFCLFFLGLVAFIVFASTHRVELVRPDYYEEEIRFQRQIDRVQRTQQVTQPLSIRYDAQQRSILLQLPADPSRRSSGTIQLYRPSDAGLDQEIPLALDVNGHQRLEANHLRSGLWKVRVQWSAGGQEYYYDQRLIIPGAVRS